MATDYLEQAKGDAKETAYYFLDEMVDQYLDKSQVSADLLNGYTGGDSYHHEYHTDQGYSFRDAAELLVQLDEYEETEEGLWQGIGMKQAVCCCAAYTFGNAVLSLFREIVNQINDDSDLDELVAEYEASGDEREEIEDKIKARIEEIIDAF